MNTEETPRQKDRGDFWRSAIALLALVGVVSFSIWYTAESQRKADQRWCALITGLDDRWRAIPSPAPEARDLSIILTDLRKRLPCSPPGPVVTDPRPSPAPSRS